MNEFIILFRETLEAALIVGIIYLFLTSNSASTQKLWLAVLTSIVASILVAYFIVSAQQALGNNSLKALFEGIFMFITAGFIWYVIFWLSKHVSDRKQLEEQSAIALSSSWGVFFLVFFSVIREGFETVVFLLASFSMTQSFSYLGFFTGALLAILIGYLIVAQGRKINLRSVFKYTTLLLVFLSAGMIAYGTHEAEEYLVKSDQIEKSSITRVWNILEPTQSIDTGQTIYHPLHDKGSIGIFLKVS